MSFLTKILSLAFAFNICLAGSVQATLADRIDKIINSSSQKKVDYGVCIVKGSTGKTVYSHNSKRAMIPASNMKIIITAAALRYLGPGFVYKTQVAFENNTLIIIGSGDPLLGDKATDSKYNRNADYIFEEISEKLKQNNITSIKEILIDTSIFDDQRVHPNWPTEQLNKWYACEVSGLNYNCNCVELTTRNLDGSVVYTVKPQTQFLQIINDVKAVTKVNDAVGAYRTLIPNKIILKGKCRKQQGPFDVAIENPAAFFGCLLNEHLHRSGINTKGEPIIKPIDKGADFNIIAEFETPLADCLARCNKNSLGIAAEALLKTIAAYSLGGKNGSWQTGREIISTYMMSLGIENIEIFIDDGSGLSRENKLSANAIVTVLSDIYSGKNWPIYKNSLAEGGSDGTIGKYFRESKYKGKIFGKTGYIESVKSFSGICETKGGDFIFSILTNNANGLTRGAINDIAEAIIDEYDS